jgi:hypothetical protein
MSLEMTGLEVGKRKRKFQSQKKHPNIQTA